MEEYLQYMKTLRFHMNDVEDQAAKISVEEQMQVTTVQTLTKEIDSANLEIIRLKEDSDVMKKEKGEICSRILERQRKIALLENDSSTLSQTLELIQQEKLNLSTKLVEKRTFFGKTEEELNTKLKQQQDWLNSYESNSKIRQHNLVNTENDHMDIEYVPGNNDAKSLFTGGDLDDAYKNMVTKIGAAKAKFDDLTKIRSELALDRDKVKQSLEELKCRMNSYTPKLRETPSETLEEEVRALMSDKSGETEFQESVQTQIDAIKEISHVVKCGCGEEYEVKVDICVQ